MGVDPARAGRAETESRDKELRGREPAPGSADDRVTVDGHARVEGTAQDPAPSRPAPPPSADASTDAPAGEDESARRAREKREAKERRRREKEEAKARREEEKRLEAERRAAEEEAARLAREEAAREAAERAVAAITAAGGFNVGGVLKEVAKPRLVGSHGADEVAGTVRACFEALGYEIDERSFRFNPLPGRFGITAAGVLYLIGALTATGLLYANYPVAALVALGALLVVAVGLALAARSLIDSQGPGSVDGLNMMAQKPGARPRYIIMAHRDSKSQPVPLAFRAPAIVVAVLVWIGLALAAAAHMARPLDPTIILVLGALAAVAGLLLVFCWVDNRSDGALDNASGVVTALNVAAREAEEGDVAFLITDAEELGLAGARAAAPLLPPVYGVINIDGLDDDGPFYVLERFGLLRKQGLAPHLAAALLQEAEYRQEPADRRDLPMGIPTDHVPIVRAGMPALTLMRGTRSSLRRVHRPADSVASLQGDGIRRGTDLICGALARLREHDRSLER